MKISIVGAGSSYTPELFEKLADVKGAFPVKKVTLMDINPDRLAAVMSFCGRYARRLGLDVMIESTTDLEQAIYGADFVNTQIRVGGNNCRVLDEKIPLSMNLIGQETTGAGGFMKALRTIPAMMEVAAAMKRNAPEAWLINYTNPTGIISQAIHDHTDIKCAALCTGGIRPTWQMAEVLGVDAKEIQCDVFGLNHLNYAYNFKVKGRPITDEEFSRATASGWGVSSEIAVKIGALVSGYLQYYYHRRKTVAKLKEAPQTRGEVVLALEKEIFADFHNSDFDQKPPSLQSRGGGGYAEVAVGVMDAIYNNRNTWHVINVPNKGVFPFLPDNAVVETAVLVNANGIVPLTASPPPQPVWGLVSQVKNYEMMTAEAALTGDKDLAVLALTHHPLVGDYDTAVILLDKMLEANRDYLPDYWFDK